MLRFVVVFLVLGPFLISVALAGSNPNAKVAIHIAPHAIRTCSKNFPAITSCEDITYTYSDSGDVDFFVVFYDLEAYTGFHYSISWPAEWSSCSFTSCSDFTIGEIIEPGDSIAQAWTDCDSSGVCIAGFGWVGDVETPGHISIGPFPGFGVDIADCEFQIDTTVVESRAGVYGATGDDPCDGRGGGDDDGGEGTPALRIVRVIEVTDGSTIYMQPIWSPDGTKLAFTKRSFEGIYVRNSNGSGPIKEITSAAYSGFEPVWTQDSRAIVTRTRTGTVGQRLACVDVETGEVNVLVERAAHPGHPERNVYGDVMVNLDGETRFLDPTTRTLKSADEYYSDERPPSREVTLEIDYRNDRVWVVEGDGQRRTEFPHEIVMVSLSPTKDRILVRLRDGNWYASSFDGSEMVNLGRGASWEWSPDGRRLVYMGSMVDSHFDIVASELFIVNADGTGLAQLTETPDQVENYPTWSPDGMKIAYSTLHTGKILVAILEEENCQ